MRCSDKLSFILLLIFLLLLPSAFAALTFDQAYGKVKDQIVVTPTTSVSRLQDLKPHQEVFEYFTDVKIFESVSESYYVIYIDYFADSIDGSPKHIIFVDKETGETIKIYLDFPPMYADGKFIPVISTLIQPEIDRVDTGVAITG